MCKLLAVKKRLGVIDKRIYELLPKLTACFIPYGYVTGDGSQPHADSLARIRENNPRAYGWLMEYKALIKEERDLQDGNDR